MLLQRNRIFGRKPPTREAAKMFVFCEGSAREPEYFSYFQELDSRIDLHIYAPSPDADNSPGGLLLWARSVVDPLKANGMIDVEKDQVWIVCDMDPDKRNSRFQQITGIQDFCNAEPLFQAGLSNPCFEVWLFYHFFSENPSGTFFETCNEWKRELNERQPFDSRKHPLLLGDAVFNAERSYREKGGVPDTGSTGVFLLGRQLLAIVEEKLASQRWRLYV